MQGNKTFPNDISETKATTKDLLQLQAVNFAPYGEEGLHINYKGGKYVPLDYIQSVCTQKCCHMKKYYCNLPLVSHSVQLSEELEG